MISAAFCGNIAWASEYIVRVHQLIDDVMRGKFQGGLLIVYPIDHHATWQMDLIDRLVEVLPPENIVLRLNGKLPATQEVVGWLNRFYYVVDHAYSRGIRMIQIGNEPNCALTSQKLEGFWESFIKIAKLLKTRYPDCQIVSPAMQPHGVNEYGEGDIDFYQAMYESFANVHIDLLGVHVKWQYNNHDNPFWGGWHQDIHDLFPAIPMVITEYGCTGHVSTEHRDRTVTEWLEEANKYDYIKMVCYFGVQLRDPENRWDTENATPELLDKIADINSKISFKNEDKTIDKQNNSQEDVKPPMKAVKIGNIEIEDLRGLLPGAENYQTRELSEIRFLVVHHTGVNVDSSAKSIAEYHVNTLGWPGIGYHFLVHPDGWAEYVGDVHQVRYNVASRNREVVGVCLVGDFSYKAPTDRQLIAARSLLANLQFALGWFVPIMGHTEIALPSSPTACPGVTWDTWKPILLGE